MEEEKIKKEIDECTFRPHINKPVASTSSTNPQDRKEYQSNSTEKGSTQKHDELLKWAEDKNKRIAESALIQNFDSVSKNSRKLATKDIEKSADRLYSSYIDIEKRKLDMQVKELDAHSFRPVINKKSQLLAENKKKGLHDNSDSSLPIRPDRKEPSFCHKEGKTLQAFESSRREAEVSAKPKEKPQEELKKPSNKPTAEKTPNGSKSPAPGRDKPATDKLSTPKNTKKETKPASIGSVGFTQPTQSSKSKIAKNQDSNKKKDPSSNKKKEEGDSWNLINRDSQSKSNQKVQYHTLSYMEKHKDQDHDIVVTDGECTYEEYYNSTVDRMNRIQMNRHELKLQDSLGLIELIPLEKEGKTVHNALPGSQIRHKLLNFAPGDTPKPKALKAINDLEKQIQKATQLVYSDNLSKSQRQNRSVNESLNSSREKKAPSRCVQKQNQKCDSTCETTAETNETSLSRPSPVQPDPAPPTSAAKKQPGMAPKQPKAAEPPASKKLGQDSLLAIMKELCQAVDEASK